MKERLRSLKTRLNNRLLTKKTIPLIGKKALTLFKHL